MISRPTLDADRATDALSCPSMTVVGSVNHDHFSYLTEFPQPGETVIASSSQSSMGGKGANQACAAALLGARVLFIGRIGVDDSGEFARGELARNGVQTEHLLDDPHQATGTAHIAVNFQGENTVIVTPGANGELTADAVEAALQEIRRHNPLGLVLAQGEVPRAAIERAAAFCAAHRIRFVLNLAPATPLSASVLHVADPLIVNQGEAAALWARILAPRDGRSRPGTAEFDAPELDGEQLADRLSRSARSVIVTAGAYGAYAADADDNRWHQPAPQIDRVVDTTGAGDAFVGTLAAALLVGRTLREAVAIGVAAGSHAVASAGTTSSYARGSDWQLAASETVVE